MRAKGEGGIMSNRPLQAMYYTLGTEQNNDQIRNTTLAVYPSTSIECEILYSELHNSSQYHHLYWNGYLSKTQYDRLPIDSDM